MTPYFPVIFDGAGDRPSLDLNFAALRQLDPRVTFTRASSATFIGPTGLVETAATGVPRFTHDPITGQSLGLLVEEARTNLLLWSEDFSKSEWVVTSGTVNRTTGTLEFVGASTLLQNVTVAISPGAVWVGSVYVRNASPGLTLRVARTGPGTFEASPVAIPVGSDWQRVSISHTFANAQTGGRLDFLSGAAGGTVEVRYAQIEAGSSATSYIPTTGAAALRAADVATITGTNFSQWYRQDEGTLFFVGTSTLSPSNHVFGGVSNGVFANSVYLIKNNLNSLTVEPNVAPTNIEINLGSYDGTETAVALGLGQTSASASRDGGAVVTDSSIYLQPANVLSIGRAPWSSSNFINGHMRKLAYYPKRLSDATLQSLTEE